ncbi:MAG: TetR/AcrR family transcriptional regulator [Clostridiales Family XIII bacterium]|jgi:AcrR family transcriptional regulator|nr:TetR/AcrR family transcriptional regulator [Clostridiales Family XIII bacterium]
MPKKIVTDRAMRAMKTKKKLFQSAVKLIDKYGYGNVTVEDICRKAGVSVGAYYHYYHSKSDIIVEFFKQIDYYYEENVEPEFTGGAAGDIEIFFRHYAKFHVDRGYEHTSMVLKVQHDFFLDKSRYMYTRLMSLVTAAKDGGAFGGGEKPERIADFLLIVARGMLFDWALAHGGYDLAEKMGLYVRRAMLAFRQGLP